MPLAAQLCSSAVPRAKHCSPAPMAGRTEAGELPQHLPPPQLRRQEGASHHLQACLLCEERLFFTGLAGSSCSPWRSPNTADFTVSPQQSSRRSALTLQEPLQQSFPLQFMQGRRLTPQNLNRDRLVSIKPIPWLGRTCPAGYQAAAAFVHLTGTMFKADTTPAG